MMRSALLFFFACSFAVAPALADEAAIRRALEGKLPAPIERVLKTAYPGLYEINFDKKIAYTNGEGSFLLVGNLIDVKTGAMVTQQRLRKLTAIDFSSLPLELAIKTVRGKGSRVLAVFSDPLCPYCKKQEQELAKLADVTMYTFLTPFERLHPGATAKSRAIWCAADRAAAWEAFMLKGKEPAPASCADPVAQTMALGEKHGFDSTPTLVFSDGAVVRSVRSAAQVERLINEATRK